MKHTVWVNDRENVEVILVDVRLDGGVRAVFGQEVVCNVLHNLRSVSIMSRVEIHREFKQRCSP